MQQRHLTIIVSKNSRGIVMSGSLTLHDENNCQLSIVNFKGVF